MENGKWKMAKASAESEGLFFDMSIMELRKQENRNHESWKQEYSQAASSVGLRPLLPSRA